MTEQELQEITDVIAMITALRNIKELVGKLAAALFHNKPEEESQ